MYPNEVRDHFETWAKASRELNISNNTYQGWTKNGSIPIKMQHFIESQCRGYLKADPQHDAELQRNIADMAKAKSMSTLNDLFGAAEFLMQYSSENKIKCLDRQENREILFNKAKPIMQKIIRKRLEARHLIHNEVYSEIKVVIEKLIKDKEFK